MSAPPLLGAAGVTKTFRIGSRFAEGGRRTVQALSDVSLELFPGETLGLVGESGCGKSTLGRSLLRLYDIDAGAIAFKGRDISRLGQRRLRPLRAEMQMVFQDPYASLNPRRRIRDLIADPLLAHGRPRGSEIDDRLAWLMDRVNLPREFLGRYPHEFSGGQRQRIGIARALASAPSLIVADEPVSALDVSVQAQIVNLFMDLQQELGLAYLFIAHDLAVVRQIAARVAVMYLGRIVEQGETDGVLRNPAHPYTAALVSAVPDPHGRRPARTILLGEPPSPIDPPSGCRFHPRCPTVRARCRAEAPPLRRLAEGRQVACHFPLTGEGLA
jgi:peptide/nickel transport system ATP-binding protein